MPAYQTVTVVGLLDDELDDFERALNEASTAVGGRAAGLADWRVRAHSFTSAGLTSLKDELHNTDALIFVPRLPTWSRLPATNTRGPRPMRSRRFPWGEPWVSGANSSRLNDENELMHLVIRCMTDWLRDHATSDAQAKKWLALISPEDLGPTSIHDPASIWQITDLHDLARKHLLHRVAFCQCRFSETKQPRPTGMLTTAMPPGGVFKLGWPRIYDTYLGPLPHHCGCHTPHSSMQAIGKRFRTPRRMLEEGAIKAVAATLVSHFVHSENAAQGLLQEGVRLAAFKALLPRALLYDQDEDGYDTDATILVDPPELGEGNPKRPPLDQTTTAGEASPSKSPEERRDLVQAAAPPVSAHTSPVGQPRCQELHGEGRLHLTAARRGCCARVTGVGSGLAGSPATRGAPWSKGVRLTPMRSPHPHASKHLVQDGQRSQAGRGHVRAGKVLR